MAKGTGRAVFNLTTVNVGCQDEAVVTQVADVAYGSCVDGALARTFRRFAALVGCGHVSGLLMRQVWPLALMLCADRVPIVRMHWKVR